MQFLICLLFLPLLAGCRSDQNRLVSGPPAWAVDAVWYQVFPERFRNGDSSNDPRAEDLAGSWPHEVAVGWSPSSWTGDWYAYQDWERDGKPFYFHVQQRRYGGDLQGIIDKLDYLRDLGVTALYLNPIFESPSLHKYDATMYHHVDNNFGPDPDGDRAVWAAEDPGDPATWRWTSADSLFLRLIREVHARDMKIIIDGVFNHVGLTFWAFDDARRRGAASPYASWFTIDAFDDPSTPANEFSYKGWMGVRELPEIREDSSGLVAGAREHVRAIVRRWGDPNGDGDPSDGVDGWRLDVAEKVSIAFWRDFRSWVKEINPDAFLTGEVWWEDWGSDKMFNAAPWLQGDVFDAVMNYRWAREACLFFAGRSTRITAAELSSRTSSIRADYPDDASKVLMNLYDSHDTDRILSRIVNPDLSYDKRVGLNDNPAYDIRKPNAEEVARLRLMVLYQMTSEGAPMIYYGSESGMWGGDDPDCRKPMLWADMVYEPERGHPFKGRRPADVNAADSTLHGWYKRMIALRRGHRALRSGSTTWLTADGGPAVAVMLRQDGEESVLVVLNADDRPYHGTIALASSVHGRRWSALHGEPVASTERDRLSVRVGAWEGLVLEGTR